MVEAGCDPPRPAFRSLPGRARTGGLTVMLALDTDRGKGTIDTQKPSQDVSAERS
jgi:hypothetical protein